MAHYSDDSPRSAGRTVPAENFVATLAANVDNPKLDDKAFREFVRNTLPIVVYPASQPQAAGPRSQFDDVPCQR